MVFLTFFVQNHGLGKMGQRNISDYTTTPDETTFTKKCDKDKIPQEVLKVKYNTKSYGHFPFKKNDNLIRSYDLKNKKILA